MKIFVGFIGGVLVCGLLMVSASIVMPIHAETDGLSENNSLGLAELIPDIERIYNQALMMPFEKAESKIYDEDIAEYYRELLTKTGLRSGNTDTP
jgi:hypothetical protein